MPKPVVVRERGVSLSKGLLYEQVNDEVAALAAIKKWTKCLL